MAARHIEIGRQYPSAGGDVASRGLESCDKDYPLHNTIMVPDQHGMKMAMNR